MAEQVKGTVTSLSSLFPADETQKALRRVNDAISERRKQLDQLNDFIADNKNLIGLVQRLPDKLHHDIMVPFGKAAFFPGRLIHTNEFLVLLGEGYYADRSSKQTAEILTRRGKALESQVKSLEAVMQDLKAEASFFDATATESAEGFVEIREDIVEETSETSYGESAASVEAKDEDEEYARIFSRIAELEKEEEEAEKANETSEDTTQEVKDEDEEYARILSQMAELEKEEEEEAEKASESSEDESEETIIDRSIHQHTHNKKIGSSKVDDLSNLTERARPSKPNSDEGRVTSTRYHSKKDFSDQFHVEASNARAIREDDYLQGECLPSSLPSSTEITPRLPVVKENVKAPPVVSEKKAVVDNTRERFDASKAFTGSIVERPLNIDMKPRDQTVGCSSKPISRFKMERK